MAKVGRGELPSSSVIEAIYPDLKQTAPRVAANIPVPAGEGWFSIGSRALKFKIPNLDKHLVPGEESLAAMKNMLSNLTVKFAPNGGAVPGDRIVGILEPGIGVTVYPIQSPSLSKFDDLPGLWLDVRWDVDRDSTQLFPARIVANALNEPGTLAQIAQIIANRGSNIERIELIHGATDFTGIEVDLMVSDLKRLNQIMAEIKASPVVSAVTRINE